MARTRAKNLTNAGKKKEDVKKRKSPTNMSQAKGKGKGKGKTKTKTSVFNPIMSDVDNNYGNANGGPWTLDSTRQPRICSERRVIAKNHVCYLRMVSLFSEATGARFDARQFCIERSYVNRNSGARDQFLFTLNITALPALIYAAQEFNKVG